MLRIGKFEWKIISALLLTAAMPLLFTIVIGDRLIEESMEIGLNDQVLGGLEKGVTLYKETIQARIKLAKFEAERTARQPAFLEAVRQDDFLSIRKTLQDLVDQNRTIGKARFFVGDDLVLEEDGPEVFSQDEARSRIESIELQAGRRIELLLVVRKEVLAASEKLRDLVVTLQEVKKNFQPWKMSYYRLFIFIYTWILVAAVVFGLFLARSVTRRVAKLVRAIQQVAQGDLTVRVSKGSQDEIGLLSKSFNLMLDEIQRSRDRIVYLEKVSAWQEIARRLAHEIKNPLTPIQLAIQELHRSYRGQDEKFKRKLDDSLEIVEEEIETLRRLVQTFSDFAKLPEVQPEPMNLKEFVEDFLKHNPQLSDRVEMLPSISTTVRLDKTLMKRVLMNLISNGLEANPTNEARVWIQTGAQAGWSTVRIEDNGTGLAEEVRERIFQPYFTTKPNGTGLGLAIVKKIVLQHKGEIGVLNLESGGAVFEIRLQTVLSPEA